MQGNELTVQKTTRPNIRKMEKTHLRTLVTAATIILVISLALAPGGARAQAPTTGGTAVVVVVVHVIHTDAGTKQASDFDVQVAYARPSTHTEGSTCATNRGTYTAIHKPGSESGTSFTIPAPSCFCAAITNLQIGDTINSSPCDRPQFNNPSQTVTCTYTIRTQ